MDSDYELQVKNTNRVNNTSSINFDKEAKMSHLTQDMFEIKEDCKLNKKNDKSINYLFNEQIEEKNKIIDELKKENENLKTKLSEQIKIYNNLIVDFYSQQNLLENKSILITEQLEKINNLINENNKLKTSNIQFEETISKINRMNQENIIKKIEHKENYLKNDSNFAFVNKKVLSDYQKEIEKLKKSNSSLSKENNELTQDNLSMKKVISDLKNNDYKIESNYKNNFVSEYDDYKIPKIISLCSSCSDYDKV